jgi:multiple sugar transport system ATP-binding protein
VEPAVLLMDEPLSNLDALLRLEMRAELKGILQESKTTTIYVTHDQVEAMSLADRIAVMHQGRIVQAAPATEVYAFPATRFVGGFIGNPPMNFLPASVSGSTAEVAGLKMAAPASARPMEFAIRPEEVTPSSEGLTGRVRVVEPLGPHQLVSLDVGGHLFRAVLENDHKVRSGETLTLAPRPGSVRWFDVETSAAVQ